jgi:CheY-like chemotaxis protein
MAVKILLADDSLTIQKVVKISLANEPFEIIVCDNASSLVSMALEHKPSLLLLDFNLSDSKNGYDLAQSVIDANPSIKVLMLYGTFDTVDDEKLQDLGAEQIIKPFDGSKFIKLCQKLTSEVPVTETEEDLFSDKITTKDLEISIPPAIEDDLDHWELEVPGVIGKETSLSVDQELPEIIPEIIPEKPQLDTLPPAADLEYPSLEIESHTSQPINEPVELGTVNVEDVKKIESLIEDEVSEDLWSADIVEHVPLSKNENPEVNDEFVPTKIEELPQIELEEVHGAEELELEVELESDDFDDWKQEPSHSLQPENMIEVGSAVSSEISSNINYDQLKNEIIESLKPMLVDLVKEFSKESVERVAWEVIPDLAENLIKLELSKLADSVLKNDE